MVFTRTIGLSDLRSNEAWTRVCNCQLCNSPPLIYLNFSTTLRLYGQISIFRLVFFALRILLGIKRQRNLEKFTILFSR